jgi:hypothetical protein
MAAPALRRPNGEPGTELMNDDGEMLFNDADVDDLVRELEPAGGSATEPDPYAWLGSLRRMCVDRGWKVAHVKKSVIPEMMKMKVSSRRITIVSD